MEEMFRRVGSKKARCFAGVCPQETAPAANSHQWSAVRHQQAGIGDPSYET